MSKRRSSQEIPRFSNCRNCGKTVEIVTNYQRDRTKNPGWVHCSTECAKEFHRKTSSKTAARTNRKYASKRMTAKNPMKSETSRLKMQRTLVDMGHKPKVRGGNGTGNTVPQDKMIGLLKAHFQGIESEYIFPTKIPRGMGFPTHYKIDIAIPSLRIAIEIDGMSHASIVRQKADARKDSLLQERGWIVSRFSNKEVMTNGVMCVRAVLSTTSKSRRITTILPMAS